MSQYFIGQLWPNTPLMEGNTQLGWHYQSLFKVGITREGAGTTADLENSTVSIYDDLNIDVVSGDGGNSTSVCSQKNKRYAYFKYSII